MCAAHHVQKTFKEEGASLASEGGVPSNDGSIEAQCNQMKEKPSVPCSNVILDYKLINPMWIDSKGRYHLKCTIKLISNSPIDTEKLFSNMS